MRRNQLWPWLATLLLAAAPGRSELQVGGLVATADGEPLAGAAIELLAVRSAYQSGLAQLAGRLEPEPVAATVSADDGGFVLAAPESGFLILRVAGEGFVPIHAHLWPLVESRVLPGLVLRPDRPVEVQVRGPDGEPLAGALVAGTAKGGPPWRRRIGPGGTPWSPAPRRALTDADGRARLSRAEGESLELSAYHAGLATAEPIESSTDRVELRLAAGRPITVQVTDRRGGPLAGALVRVGKQRWAAGLTGEDGRLATALPHDDLVRGVTAAGGEGAARAASDDETVLLMVSELTTIEGRVIDADSRRPLAGALVWSDRRSDLLARSDGGGGFSLPVPGGEERPRSVQAAAAGYFDQHLNLAGEPGEPPVLALRPAAAVSGQVVDANDEPLAGVELTAEVGDGSPRAFQRILHHRAARARSGTDGGFLLPGLMPGTALRVVAVKDGYARTALDLEPLTARQTRSGLRLVLGRGAVLRGRVMGSGRPLAGAELSLRGEPEGSSPLHFMRRYEEVPATATSDAEGIFELRNLATGRYRLRVEASAFAPLTVPGVAVDATGVGTDLGTLELEPGVEIVGVVVDGAGRPLAGAEIRATNREVGAFRMRFASLPDEVPQITGADGRFVLSDRRPGERVELDIRHQDHLPRESFLVEAPTDSPVRVVLERAARVSGEVIDPTGAPVPDAIVAATPAEEGNTGIFSSRQARTDDTGRFEIEQVKPGRIRIVASARGWRPTEVSGLEVPPGESLAGLRLTLERGATVSGQVLTGDGLPASEVTVRVEVTERSPLRFAVGASAATGGDGRYVLEGVETGRRTIIARGSSGEQAVREIEVIPGVNRLDLRFAGGVELSGRVVDTSGAPIGGATISALATAGEWRGTEARSAEDGSFTIAGVQDGRYFLRAGRAGFATRTLDQPLRVAGSPLTGIELVLAPGGTVGGRILGLEPARLAEVTVMAHQVEHQQATGQVSHDGTYRIPDLAPGEWRVLAFEGRGRQAMGRVTLEPGAAEAVLDLEFSAGLVLTGQVLRSGEPLAGTSLQLRGVDVTAWSGGRTDHEGRFRIESLKPGRYQLEINDFRGGLSHRQEMELEGDREVLIEIGIARVSGRVLDGEDRSPLADASIALEPWRDEGASLPLFARGLAAESDADGRFAIANLSSGVYRLRAVRDGYAPVERRLEVAAGELVDVDLRLEPTGGLELLVRRSSGAAVGELDYALLDAGDRPLGTGRRPVDADGRVRLPSVPAGGFELLVSARGAAVQRLRAHSPGPPLTVELEPAARLTVRVAALADDESLATMRIFSSDGRPFKTIRWGSLRYEWQLPFGQQTVDGLAAGSYRVEISVPDGRTWEGTVGVTPDGANRLEL